MATHQKAEDYKRLMEQAYEERDSLVDDIGEWVRQSRDVLIGIQGQSRERIRQMAEKGLVSLSHGS